IPVWVSWIFGSLLLLGFAFGIPGAMAVAILRYRLYEIDVVLNRALVYGALAAFISAVYVGIVVGIGTLIGSRGQPNLGLSIAATAVVAVAFQPVRERIERVANRLVYGQRATPYEVLAQFSHRVAGAYANEEVLSRLARVLGEGTAAAAASVWIRSDGQLVPSATWPAEAQPMPPEQADRVAAVRHQGAQQHLVALAVKLRLAATVAKRDAEKARPSIDGLRRQTVDALETLGVLAAGLYPAALREGGIAAALRAQTALATVPSEVVDHLTARHPEELEAAVYFCCQEAIQNGIKHAKASRITVRLDDRDGALQFEVSDDGRGFDPGTVRRGAGMQNMADRIAASGGTLIVESRPDV